MEKSMFEPANVFRFNEKVEYSAEGIVSKRVIDRPVGNVTLFAFDQGQRRIDQIFGDSRLHFGRTNRLFIGSGFHPSENGRSVEIHRLENEFLISLAIIACVFQEKPAFPVIERHNSRQNVVAMNAGVHAGKA